MPEQWHCGAGAPSGFGLYAPRAFAFSPYLPCLQQSTATAAVRAAKSVVLTILKASLAQRRRVQVRLQQVWAGMFSVVFCVSMPF